MSILEGKDPEAPYCSGLSAAESHNGLKQALAALGRAEKAAVLWFAEILRRKLYRDLGYSSIHLYASEALGFKPSRTAQFIRLAEALENLPALKASVASGEVSWTKAREVARVATPASEMAWVAEAKQSSRQVLERKVAEVKDRSRRERRADPAQKLLGEALAPQGKKSDTAPPVALTFRMDGPQLARFDAIMAKLRRLGHRTSREEILLEALAAFAESADDRKTSQTEAGSTEATGDFPRGKIPGKSGTFQIILYTCEKCGEAQAVTSRGRLPVAPSALARAQCDAMILDADGRNRSTIPPATRRAVLARDGHRCRVQGCGSSQFLEVHHILPRCNGGSNKLENLLTVCSACHQLLHEKGLAAEVIFPHTAGGLR